MSTLANYDIFQNRINNFLTEQLNNLPINDDKLHQAMRYGLLIGGKRMRPVLTLMGCELFNADYKIAKHAALTVELFHNFSLIHDDIMDEAPLRRGNETVHQKWNVNIGILSGDASVTLPRALPGHGVCGTHWPSLKWGPPVM